MNKTNPKVDFCFTKAKTWQKELKKLRTIVLGCPLAEELKWGQPCYTFEERNIVLIHAFKEYCALLFFKGALLKDGKRILIQDGTILVFVMPLACRMASKSPKMKVRPLMIGPPADPPNWLRLNGGIWLA